MVASNLVDPRGMRMEKLHGGPCEGTEVLPPIPGHRGSHVCIGVPAPPEHNQTRDVWCIYMWNPKSQWYEWLDFCQCASQKYLERILRQLADDVDRHAGNAYRKAKLN